MMIDGTDESPAMGHIVDAWLHTLAAHGATPAERHQAAAALGRIAARHGIPRTAAEQWWARAFAAWALSPPVPCPVPAPPATTSTIRSPADPSPDAADTQRSSPARPRSAAARSNRPTRSD